MCGGGGDCLALNKDGSRRLKRGGGLLKKTQGAPPGSRILHLKKSVPAKTCEMYECHSR